MSVRRQALFALVAIVQGKWRIEEAIARSTLTGRDRRLLHELVYGTLRHWWRLQADWRRFVRRTPSLQAKCALAMGLYQLRVMRTPDYAAVHETTEAVKRVAPKHARFVHAVLRRAAAAPALSGVNLPGWVQRSWTQAYGRERMRAIGDAFAQTPRLAVHLFVPRAPWLDQARAVGIEAEVDEREDLVWLTPPVDVQALPGYREGAFVVLDLAAREAVEATSDLPGRLLLDACAAPGGKSAWLARLHPSARIVALEIDRARIARWQENMQRLKLQMPIVQGDAAHPPFRPASLDGVLLDAPCSASGIARRRPDVWFRHNRRSLAAFAEQQKAMLGSSLSLVRSGGWVVYVVCSLHPEETIEVVQAFRSALVDARYIFPDERHDGFFIARFRR